MNLQDIGLSHDAPPYRLHRLGVVMRADSNNPDEALGVLNPATARGPDGKLYLFARIVAAGNYSRIGIAEVRFDAQGDPVEVTRMGYVLEPTEPYERNARTAGCEDPRITFVEPLGYYVMTYTAYGPLGPRIALAWSRDLFTWQRIGPVKFAFMPRYRVDFDLYDNKDAYLFPQPVRDPQGRPALAMIHRPSNTQGGLQVTPEGIAEPRASMWISYCPLDRAKAGPEALLTWEEHQLLATPAQPWESLKIGGGTPPVLTSRGWLTIYHGVSGRIVEGVDHQPFVRYCAGAMVLDRDDPRYVIYRSSEPILSPEAPEEKEGVVANVVFPTGVDVREGGRVDVYYGMADFYIGVARMTLPD
ncbi:MAG: glycosidase [Anaerolineae bacterium]|nr:glycosidase [Candidatus Roseilinea sp.]MDW8448516.1 glycosidase [Anaerolineae bacterium]